MANSNILLFDQLMQNMLSDQEYNTSQQRQNGVQAGIASSQLHNKFSYQVSLVAYAIAQMMLANGMNALDSDQVSTFVANLSSSVVQKVLDKATQQQAVAGTDDTKWMSPLKVAQATAAITKQITQHIANRSNPHAVTAAQVRALPTAGGTMTGPITLPGNPSGALQAVPKQYVDARGWTLVNTLFSNISGNIGDGPIYSNKLAVGSIDNFTELKIETSMNITFQSQPHGLTLALDCEAGNSEILIPSSTLEVFMNYQYADRLYVLTYPYTLSGKYSVLLQKSTLGISTYNASVFKIVPVFSTVVPCKTADISSPSTTDAPVGVCSGCNIYLMAESDVSNEQQVSGNVTFNIYGR